MDSTPSHGSQTDAGKRRHNRKLSMKNHYITYFVSILLTAIAFAIVWRFDASAKFMVLFIVLLAVVQALFQIVFWMHLNEKGHRFPIAGIIMGAVVVLTLVVTAIYWVW